MSATITKGIVDWTVNGIKVNTSIKSSPSNYNNSSSRKVEYIVMHYTGNSKDLAKSNATYFANGSRSASAHLFCDDDSIYQSVELRDIAWHCGCALGYKNNCRNSNSIGIEMCCSGNYKVSAKTQKNTAFLCARLCELVGIKASQVDKYVVRHYDVVKTNKKCPAQYVNNPSEWKQFKTWVKNILKYGDIKKPTTSTITTTTTVSTSTTKSPTIAKPTLRVGSTGTQVKYLQKDLNYLGVKGADGKKLTVDGDFGNNTKVALLAFQKKYGLVQDAIYGNDSYSIMKKKCK